MLTVDEIIKLKEAGFTADEITKLSEQGKPQEPAPVQQPEKPQEPAPVQQPEKPDVWEEINKAIYHK